MNFLLDTNILLHFIRRDETSRQIETNYQPFAAANRAIVSVISFGEIKSLAIQKDWGAAKLQLLDRLLLMALRSDITLDIVEHYAEIDAFSQARHPLHISNFTARNMGKNDLWIAATASALGATLLTTDADFEHLDGHFLSVAKIAMP